MKSILVVGMGRFGKHVALKMQELGNDVVIIDKNPEVIDELAPIFADAQIGDCCHEAVLRSIGVNNFDICFVAMGEDFQSSLEVTALLKDSGAKHVVSKANSERQAKILAKIGADEVVYPEKEIAEKLAVRYNEENIFDFIKLTPEYAIYEIPIMSQWVEKSILQLDVRQKYHVNIVAVKKGETLFPAPGASYVFSADDHVVVIGKSEDVFRLAKKM